MSSLLHERKLRPLSLWQSSLVFPQLSMNSKTLDRVDWCFYPNLHSFQPQTGPRNEEHGSTPKKPSFALRLCISSLIKIINQLIYNKKYLPFFHFLTLALTMTYQNISELTLWEDTVRPGWEGSCQLPWLL